FFCRSTSQGISILQGPHHVAQKFSSTALPRRDAIGIDLPSGMLFNSNVGARPPFTGSPAFWSEAGLCVLPAPAALADSGGLVARLPTNSRPVIATTTQRIKMTFRFTTIFLTRRICSENQDNWKEP